MISFLNISRIVALAGSILTLAQILFLASDQEGICLNDGCKVVDSLTTVPPIFFNIGGFVFFQAVFWGLWMAKKNENRLYYVKMILLAGLAAEGVLVSFQQLIAQTFCSYCLIIFSLVLLLNILAGMRQLLTGAAVFFAVVVGFMSLQFAGANSSPLEKIDSGTFAQLPGTEEERRYLFFSSTCKYCEKIIESMDGNSSCGIRFNPLDEITDFALEEAERREVYQPTANRKILQSMGVDQVPVLLVVSPGSLQMLTGSTTIQQYLDKNCFDQKNSTPEKNTQSAATSGFSSDGVSGGGSGISGFDFLPPQDDACSVSVDCEDPEALVPQ